MYFSLTHSARDIFASNPSTTGTTKRSSAPRGAGPWVLSAVAAGLALLAAAHGAPVTNDQEAHWLSRLAQSGDAGAQTQLGLAYREGRYGLPMEPQTAMRWLEAGARNGNSYAATALGDAYAQGEGTTADRPQAEQWWQKAATAGDARAQRELGQALVADSKPEQARTWLRLAADQGDAQAQASLRELTRAGLASVDDARRGENSLAASARRLDSPSLGLVAAAWDALGYQAPAGERISRLQAEARAGDPVAQYELGERYADAWGVARDDAKAMRWLQASAAAGNGLAMKTLADVYREGKLGVSADIERAAQWQRRADHAASPL